MGRKIVRTHRPPKRRVWTIDIEGSAVCEREFLEDVAAMTAGDVFWTVVWFRPPNTRRHERNPRKKRFKTDVPVYKFWLTREADAVVMKLRFQ